jgi:putative phosphoesterase
MSNNKIITIGLISDTHGLVRPEVMTAFKGVDRIIHAGDIDQPQVLEALEEIAPVRTVRGNMDYGRWAQKLPLADTIEIEGLFLHVLHDLQRMGLDPLAGDISAVISGHTHRPLIEEKQGIIYINPGSAGYGRSGQPVTVARLSISRSKLAAEIIELKC